MSRCGAGILAAAWVFTCAAVWAEWNLAPPIECNSETGWRVESSAAVLEPQGNGVVIPRVAGGVHLNEPGQPDLPFLVQLLPVLRDCNATIVIDDLESHETNGIQVAARGGYTLGEDENGNPRIIAQDVGPSKTYQQDAWWPRNPLEISYITQGKKRWARLVFHPFQFNPVRGILRFNDSIDARLVWRETKVDDVEEHE